MGLRLLLLVVILTLNAFFAAAETALVSVRRSRLKARADQGEAGAQIALGLLEHPERLLSVSQVGMTITALGLGWAGEETVYELFVGALHPLITEETKRFLHALSFVIAFLVISFVHIIVGEVIPKNLAFSKPDRLAVLLAPPLLIFQRVSSPFVWIVERCSAWITAKLGLAGGGHGTSGGGHSPEEIKFIVDASREEGHIDEFESKAITRMLDLQNVYVREVMVPRNAVVAVGVDATLDEVLACMLEHKYSRVPVYEGTIDQIIGVLHYKDMMRIWQDRRSVLQQKRPERPFRIRRYIRKILIVPETKPLHQLVDEFRESHTHLAIVVDEYGTVAGIVTLEDVFEQIFGEIVDEHDVRIQKTDSEATAVDVEGTILIRDLAAMHRIELPGDSGFETLAGFLLFKLGRIPEKAGEEIEYGGRRYTIVEMEKNRIARVRIEKIEPVAVSEAS